MGHSLNFPGIHGVDVHPNAALEPLGWIRGTLSRGKFQLGFRV